MLRLFSITFISIMLIACNSSGNAGNNSIDLTDNIIDENSEFCPTGSIYDAAEDFCFIDCDGLSDEQCDALEEDVFGDFDDFVVDNYGGAAPDNESSAKAKYTIENNLSLTSIDISQPVNDNRYREIWRNASAILPKSNVAESFSQFHIDSDGEGETLAYVTNDVNAPGKWIIAYDDADYTGPKDPEFTHTTVHEFGHIVFLGVGQLDTNSMGGCPNYDIQEGCSFEASYINQFFDAFWNDIIDEHRAIQNEEQAEAFYDKYRDRFVSEYAATNPVEDAAEVFTNFVFRDKPTDNNSVINKKILLMHGFDALVKLRKDIRGKLTITRARQQRARL